MTKPLTLTDICPEDASFTLASGKTYTVRKFNLQDQAWIQKSFQGEQALNEAFKDPETICRICFHQMPVEQQKAFSAVEVERVDEETGEVIVERLGGWRLFAASITNGPQDLTEMAKALTAAMVGSAAIVDESEKAPAKKKNQQTSRIGASSLTSSPASTAGTSAQSGA